MKKFTAYVVSYSTYDPMRNDMNVKQIGIFDTSKDAVAAVELSFGGKDYILKRDLEQDTFEAAWWATSKKDGHTFRLDVGARDAWIGDLDEPVPADAAHAFVF